MNYNTCIRVRGGEVKKQKLHKICSDMDCGKYGSLLDCIQHVKISLVLTADFYCQLYSPKFLSFIVIRHATNWLKHFKYTKY